MRQLNQSELGSVAGGCLCFWSWFSWCKPATTTCAPKPTTCTPKPTCGTPTTPPPQPN